MILKTTTGKEIDTERMICVGDEFYFNDGRGVDLTPDELEEITQQLWLLVVVRLRNLGPVTKGNEKGLIPIDDPRLIRRRDDGI